MSRILLLLSLLVSLNSYAQWKSYIVGAKGDTLNCVDKHDLKQGKWVNHVDEIRGEPGYEEEGVYKDNRKEGVWRIYTLMGDLMGVEFYKWGNKDGVCQYFATSGALVKEESWRALNPDKAYDTLQVEDIDHLDKYKTVIVKNDGVAIRDGLWKYYDPILGTVIRTESYTLGKLNAIKADGANTASNAPKTDVKPKEVLDFEKKTGKKKVNPQDGSVY
jgi:antitoxin component YwqK of YwqJK toxin-antitoxin module